MSEPEVQVRESVISRSRLEMLFDGIFAIAMTILVLELKVPEIANRNSVAELATALRHDGPTFFSYVLSFAVLGMMWYRHNVLYRHVERISAAMLALQLLQLAAAAFFPFCAALLGRYPTNPATLIIYSGCMLVYQSAATVYWTMAKRSGSLRASVDEAEYHGQVRRLRRATVILSMLVLYSVFLSTLRRG